LLSVKKRLLRIWGFPDGRRPFPTRRLRVRQSLHAVIATVQLQCTVSRPSILWRRSATAKSLRAVSQPPASARCSVPNSRRSATIQLPARRSGSVYFASAVFAAVPPLLCTVPPTTHSRRIMTVKSMHIVVLHHSSPPFLHLLCTVPHTYTHRDVSATDL
jgi:hypothetical protein